MWNTIIKLEITALPIDECPSDAYNRDRVAFMLTRCLTQSAVWDARPDSVNKVRMQNVSYYRRASVLRWKRYR